MGSVKSKKEEALLYHSEGRPGKIEVIPTKPYSTQKDLSLAYSPGVAEPCLAIEKNPEDAYKYTAKGNLVAVISNGTAVLGLGDIGAMAGKPVMEGKGLLFKTFADIDVFDIEVDTKDTEKFIDTVKNISVTFGGINLEDIKAPECFIIEERLKEELTIPVMHDDQHGTAIISSAALLNALEIAGKKIDKITLVINGAGAAAISCTKLYMALGVRKENVVMFDSRGAITTSRTDLNDTKKQFATSRKVGSLAEALKGADMFLGLSVADVLTAEMVKGMAKNPIVFALANPDPEIEYSKAKASRKDIIFATGRSDYPNQVNNVLGFPYIFRGALDVRASKINEAMKIGAVHALAELAREAVPDNVLDAYNDRTIAFGRDYLIPKPIDERLITRISVAVAKAAIESGVARKAITDWDAYRDELESRMGRGDKLLRSIRVKARTSSPVPRTMVISEGENVNMIKAAVYLMNDDIITPILIGNREKINRILADSNLELDQKLIVDFRSPEEAARRTRYGNLLYEKVSRKGTTFTEAQKCMMQREWFSLMMITAGDADTCMLGYSRRYTRALKPIREVFTRSYDDQLASMMLMTTKQGPLFFADTAVNTSPTAANLVDLTVMAARAVKKLGMEPVVSLVSHSNFGTDTEPSAIKVAEAVRILHVEHPDIIVDGEMKVDVALNKKLRSELYPFNSLGDRDVNTLIFPNLSAANISYKMMKILGGAGTTGPILMGLDPSRVHLIGDDASMRSIINLGMVAAVLAPVPDKKEEKPEGKKMAKNKKS